MIYKSFLEMAKDEDRLCQEIQLRLNIIDAADQVRKDGGDVAAHGEMLAQASAEIARLLPALHTVRAAMGGRLMMLEDMAAVAIRERLGKPGGEA